MDAQHADSLLNLDPTDIAVLDEKPAKSRGIKADRKTAAARPELKRQAQEWAGIKRDPRICLCLLGGSEVVEAERC